MSVEEGTFRTRDGIELFTKTWRAEGTPKARMVFVHGYADHADAQGKFFPLLAAKGITVFAFDQRGWGRSAIDKAQWGRSGGTEQIMEDLTAFIKSVPNAEGQPLFLMGHSMGGNEILYYTATGPKEVLSSLRGVIAEAPFIDVAPKSRPLPGLQTISHLLARLVPNMQWPQKVDIGLVSRDPAVVEAIRTDPHVHQLGTVIGLESMLTRGEELEAGKVKIEDGKLEGGKTRLLVLFGDADDVCWHDAGERLVKATQVQDKEFKSYPGWFHKLHDDGSEADKQQFADDVAQWILARCSL